MKRKVFALVLTVVMLFSAVAPAGALGTSTGEAPLADAGLDQRVTAGTTVTLDATGSRDPDGRIVDYRWRIETPDGRIVTPTPPNRGRTGFTVTTPGQYNVTVTVTDDDGNVASDTLYIVDEPTSTASPETAVPTPDGTPAPPVTTGGTPTSSPTTAPTAPTPAATPTEPGPPGSVATIAGTPTGPSVVPDGDGPAVGLPPEDPPTCAETFGPDCIEIPDCTEDPELQCAGTLRISGPVTLAEEEVGTYTAVADGFIGDVSFRWRSGEVSRSIQRKFPPGEYTLVVTATNGDGTRVAEKTVHVERNVPPKVAIEDPRNLQPGESVVLSLAELSDPDGSVMSVSWSGGSTVQEVNGLKTLRSVTVPNGNQSKRISVTATDDDGETATESVVISSQTKIIQTSLEVPTVRTAECTFYEQSAKEVGQPILCWDAASGEVIYDRDPGEGPENAFDPHSHPNYDVNWYRVGRSNDDSIEPGTASARRVDSPNDPIQLENTARANNSAPANVSVTEVETSSESDPGFEPYSKNGQSVSTDLTGDGRVDLQDWQERYGDPAAASIEDDRETISNLNLDSEEDTSQSSSDDPSNLDQSIQDAFDQIGDTISSAVGGGSEDSGQVDQQEDDDNDSIVDSATEIVDDVTEAFNSLTTGGSSSPPSDSRSGDDDEGSSDSDSANSCSNTGIGFGICL